MGVYEVLYEAITKHHSLRVMYKGHERLISPHKLGTKQETGEDGKPYPHRNVFVYQFGGYSSKIIKPDGSKDNWRCWYVEDITGISVLAEERWHTSHEYAAGVNHCIDSIHIEA